MRAPARFAWIVIAIAGCSVPDKKTAAPDDDDEVPTDGGVDTPPDSDAPETTIDEAPAEFSPAGQATFRFSSNDPAASFECRIDDEVPQPCRSPYARTLRDGPHSFSVRALDAARNGDDTPAERVWTIDTVAPGTMLTDGPPSADNSVMATFAFLSLIHI